MSAPRLTRPAFRAWLAGMPPYAKAGVPKKICRCPLARFLESTGAPAPAVLRDEYRLEGGSGTSRALPTWAVSFVRRLDRSHSSRDYVTAAEALAVLDWDAP